MGNLKIIEFDHYVGKSSDELSVIEVNTMHILGLGVFLEIVFLCSFGDSPMKVSRILHTTSAVVASLSLMQSVARCCFCALVYRECRGELPPAKAGEVAENELSVIFMASIL